LTVDDLIYGVRCWTGTIGARPVASMPGVGARVDRPAAAGGEQCAQLGIPVLALFPVSILRSNAHDGREAVNRKGWCRGRRGALKQRLPGLGVLTDFALDPYTTHGQDGRGGRQAGIRAQRRKRSDPVPAGADPAQAGVDIVAPAT